MIIGSISQLRTPTAWSSLLWISLYIYWIEDQRYIRRDKKAQFTVGISNDFIDIIFNIGQDIGLIFPLTFTFGNSFISNTSSIDQRFILAEPDNEK